VNPFEWRFIFLAMKFILNFRQTIPAKTFFLISNTIDHWVEKGLTLCFVTWWKYIVGVIGKCLWHKISSLEQLNSYELEVFYCLIRSKRVGFANYFSINSDK